MNAAGKGYLSNLLGAVIVLGLCFWGINSCVQRGLEEDRAERERRAKLTPEERAEEDRQRETAKAAEEAKKLRDRREEEAATYAQDYVKVYLKFPDEAKFASGPTVAANKAGDVWQVASTVQAKNAFGVRSTYQWRAILFIEANTWHLVHCVLDGEEVYSDKKLLDKLKDRSEPTHP